MRLRATRLLLLLLGREMMLLLLWGNLVRTRFMVALILRSKIEWGESW